MSSTQMTAAVLYGKEDVRIEKVAIPQVSEKEVLVRIKTALTCGTDAKVYQRGYHARMITPPAIFGHEFAGVIEKVGDEVDHFKPGMRVVAANSAPCNECFYCKRGTPSMCDDLLFINGAYAEFIKIPDRIVRHNLLELPHAVSYQNAAMVEPLACVLRALEETGIRRGDTIAVIGTGPIGMMFMKLAKLKGAHVIAVGRREERLEIADRLGADQLVNAAKERNLVATIRSFTEGHRGVDVAIEAVGTPKTWEMAVAMVRKGGTVNLFGGCAADTSITLDTKRIHYSEITIKASFHHTPQYIRAALDVIKEGKIDAHEFISGREPLSKLPEVLDLIVNRRNGDLKVAIVP